MGKLYILRTKDHQYVAIDRSSGGYPYTVKNIEFAYLWQSEEEAQSYLDMFKGSDIYGLTSGQICELEYKITPLK